MNKKDKNNSRNSTITKCENCGGFVPDDPFDKYFCEKCRNEGHAILMTLFIAYGLAIAYIIGKVL